jgi:integrase
MAKDKRKRAPRGSGTVFYSKARGLWIARKVVGRKGLRTVYLERTGATQKEAIANRDRATPPDPDTTTVAGWAETWFEGLDVSPLSKDAYRASLDNHILPHLGAVKLKSLTAHRVEVAARVWGHKVSATSVGNVLACLRACLGAAVRAELIDRNPVSAAKKPRKDTVHIDPFSPAELASIIAAATAEPGWRSLALLAATGMRVGEVVALEVNDFDPAAGTVAITKGDRRHHGLGPPKSRRSVRTIRVPAPALPALVAAKGARVRGALFLNGEGGQMRSWSIRDAWVELLEGLGLAFRNLHQLRHSVGSVMVAAGVPVTEVAAYLGDSVETVVRTYLHSMGGDPAAAVENALKTTV